MAQGMDRPRNPRRSTIGRNKPGALAVKVRGFGTTMRSARRSMPVGVDRGGDQYVPARRDDVRQCGACGGVGDIHRQGQCPVAAELADEGRCGVEAEVVAPRACSARAAAAPMPQAAR